MLPGRTHCFKRLLHIPLHSQDGEGRGGVECGGVSVNLKVRDAHTSCVKSRAVGVSDRGVKRGHTAPHRLIRRKLTISPL